VGIKVVSGGPIAVGGMLMSVVNVAVVIELGVVVLAVWGAELDGIVGRVVNIESATVKMLGALG